MDRVILLRGAMGFVGAALLAVGGCPAGDSEQGTGAQESGARDAVSAAENGAEVGSVGLKVVEFAVDGMTCTGCEEAIKAEILALPGVKSVEADHAAGSTSVVYDPEQATPEAMITAMEPLGYHAEVRGIMDA